MLNVMDDYEFLKRATLEEIRELCPENEKIEEWTKPFNYMELFAPKSAADLRKVVGAAAPVGAKDGPSTSRKDRDSSAGEGEKKAENPPANGRKEGKTLKDLI